jgi:deoxyribodipyrimidine photo-lyase
MTRSLSPMCHPWVGDGDALVMIQDPMRAPYLALHGCAAHIDLWAGVGRIQAIGAFALSFAFPFVLVAYAMSAPVILWFRQDLRLTDNPALQRALQTGRPLLPVYIDDASAPWRPGGASRWWLHFSLAALDADLRRRGSRLLMLRGSAFELIPRLASALGAAEILWNRCYDPFSVRRDQAIKQALTGSDGGRRAVSLNAGLLHEPWEILTPAETPYKVFTPYWRAVLAVPPPPPPLSGPPERLPPSPALPQALGLNEANLDDLRLLPRKPDWATGLRQCWPPSGAIGERAAMDRLDAFLAEAAANYGRDRDRPDMNGISTLSPHLHHGEISPRQIWQMAGKAKAANPAASGGIDAFLRQIGWREFCHATLYYAPHLPERPLNPRFEAMPWRDDPSDLAAWRSGMTGYPIVDAGMRQLWQTGFMHNRVRMIVGSFLVKHLLLPWQTGQAWFWDTLVDADLANNAAGWQWIAGCGLDAAPYFRIFNPMIQAQKFDPDGQYVRRWLPELGGLPIPFLHAPWTASPLALADAGVRLGSTYPRPMIDHEQGRARALAALAVIKGDVGSVMSPAP